MVVAEVPLWVTHNIESPDTGTHPSHFKSGGNSSTNGASSAAAAAAGAGRRAAAASLALLQEEKKKCAIYAVDVHPSGTKFATAGGDGTVRLWSTATLFAAKTKGGRYLQQQQKKKKAPPPPSASASETNNKEAATAPKTAPPTGPIGGYVSTTASSGNSSSSSSNSSLASGDGGRGSGSGSDPSSSKKKENNGNKSASSGSSDGGKSSSSDSSVADDAGSANTETSLLGNAIPNSMNVKDMEEEEIHDLNDVVRRKKDGEPASPTRKTSSSSSAGKQPPAAANGDKKQQTQNQQQQQHHHGHNHHRLLCTLSAHTGSSVLAIRFSKTGNFLASAGDDGCVCLYAPNTSASSALVLQGNLVDGGAPVAVEHWSRIALCRGHNLDVVGLAWAPDDSHLVSCSLDRETPIIVWKLTDLVHDNDSQNDSSQHQHHQHSMIRNPYKILGKDVHSSTVKGVTFDPAGSYLASSGDDPAVCIWRAHDDWGLEKRIDASSKIFRQWKDDTQSLSSQSLFRRLSWSTDGAFICSTNSVVKNKHVASTISRQGWSTAASSGGANAAGAANLVGHRQPVVVSRHAAQLLAAPKKSKKNRSSKDSDDDDSSHASVDENDNDDDDDDDEPEYATLLALGDKRGFVTVWSTRKSRPIFKLQCSETRCTVTDLAWGRIRRGSGGSSSSSRLADNLILLVSLLDGQVVALKFDVPNEIGPLLSAKDQARVFSMRYGIDVDDAGTFGQRRLLVGENAGRPQFLENALQINLESSNNNKVAPPVPNDDSMDVDEEPGKNGSRRPSLNELSVRSQQTESRSKGGKKRVQPVLLNMSGNSAADKKRARPSSPAKTSKSSTSSAEKQAPKDPLERAMNAAERASAITETTPVSPGNQQRSESFGKQPGHGMPPPPSRPPQFGRQGAPSLHSFSIIPHSTERIHSVDLPVTAVGDTPMADQGTTAGPSTASRMTAECTNSSKIPYGSKGASLPVADVTISQGGRAMWRDQITGTSCTALAASRTLLVVGTADGTIQLFATSPSLGWNCGNAFRSHPPLVVGQPVVALQVKEMSVSDSDDSSNGDKDHSGVKTQTALLVLTADGSFGVYSLVPEARLLYKGSIMPAMTSVSLGLSFLEQQQQQRIPKLSRIQITESGRLLLLLSLQQQTASGTSNADRGGRSSSTSMGSTDGGTGGSLQAFVYNQSMELWMRLSDSKFVLSDFYSSLPLSSQRGSQQAATMETGGVGGPLSRLDDVVRMGALDSALKPSLRGQTAGAIYRQSEQDLGTFIPTRSHCEDRMACALALGSAAEFQHWLSLYARVLSVGGYEPLLRMLVDMLMGTEQTGHSSDIATSGFWWLSSAPQVLGLDRKDLVRSIVVREMSKNRALQRTTNEVALELDS